MQAEAVRLCRERALAIVDSYEPGAPRRRAATPATIRHAASGLLHPSPHGSSRLPPRWRRRPDQIRSDPIPSHPVTEDSEAGRWQAALLSRIAPAARCKRFRPSRTGPSSAPADVAQRALQQLLRLLQRGVQADLRPAEVDTTDPEQLLAVEGALPLLLSCGFVNHPQRRSVLASSGCGGRREARAAPSGAAAGRLLQPSGVSCCAREPPPLPPLPVAFLL